MLNPLWPGLELVMADTSAEVPLPPDHEARLSVAILQTREQSNLFAKA